MPGDGNVGTLSSFTIRGIFSTASLCARLLWHFRKAGRPSVVHLHWSRGMLGAVLAARVAHVPVVVTEHGGPWPAAPKGSRRLWEPRLTLNLSHAVVPVSDWLASQLVEKGVTAPMRVVPNIVDPADFFPADSRPGDSRPGAWVAVMVARLDGHPKGIPDAIEAVRLLTSQGVDVHLNIVGEGTGRPRFEALAEELQVTDRIHFLGGKSRGELGAILRQSHVFVSASRQFETFGVAIAEGMACGLPVVATDVGAIAELVVNDVNGVLVPESNPAELARGIRLALDREWDPRRIVETVARLDPIVVGQQISSVYADVINAGS
jgi:glycosyltransferase involved in cell wall biosynthesis